MEVSPGLSHSGRCEQSSLLESNAHIWSEPTGVRYLTR
jgi:hypothetical protein